MENWLQTEGTDPSRKGEADTSLDREKETIFLVSQKCKILNFQWL